MEKEIQELEEAIEQTRCYLESLESRLLPNRTSAGEGRSSAKPDGSSAPRLRPPADFGIATPRGCLAPNMAATPLATTLATTLATSETTFNSIQPPTAEAELPLPITASADEVQPPCTPALTRPAAVSRTPAKLPKFNGVIQLEPYLAQVQLAAWHSGWSNEETATHLALALEGQASQVLLDLAPAEQQDLQALKSALERRFGRRPFTDQSRERLSSRYRQEGESLGTFAADVQLHTRHGYPRFQAAAQEELALDAFLRGLTPVQLRRHVRLTMPRSLSEALREAERAEVVLMTQPTQQRAPAVRPHVRRTDYDEEEEAEETCQVQTLSRQRPPLSRRRPRMPTGRCYRCDEPGHIARHCLAPAPKATTAQPEGNEGGVV